MKIYRRNSKVIKIGKVAIGGSNKIAIQSMTKVKASNAEKTVAQIKALENQGCDIVRLAVKDFSDAKSIKQIRRAVKLPIVADIHFDYRLALEAINNGIDKIRLNPGNIFKKEEIREVVSAAKLAGIPIRVGLNSGSVKRTRSVSTVDAMVRSALSYISSIEKMKFHLLVISLKGSGILDTVEANRKIAKSCDYPLHLGVTATGAPYEGTIKSGIALGALLLEGIGDTIRVSLTDKPAQEVKAAKGILKSLGLRNFGPEIISCPTCGRCEVDLVKIVKELENRLSAVSCQLSARPPKVAVMGCIVNGPGEAKEADIGIAFGKEQGLLFRNGKIVKKVLPSDCIDTLLKELKK